MKKFDSSTPRAPRRRRLAALAVALGVVFAVSAIATPASAAPRVSTLTVGAQSGTLTAGTAGSATYLVTATNGTILPVTANLSVSGLPAGATASFSPSSLSWPFFSSGATRTSTLTVNTTGAVPAGATSFTVTATRNTSPGDNASGTATLTIAAGGSQAQTITFAPIAGRTFGDADFNVGATATSGLPVTFAAAGTCTVAGSLVHLTGAGSCTVTASQAGNASYLPAPDVPRTFAIAKASQTIDFAPIASQSTSGSFTPTATATSGLAVSFAASGSCSLVGGVVELAATAGSCTVTASQAGNANYAAAPAVPRTFAVVAPGAGGQIDLYAVEGSVTFPGAAGPVPVYGYSIDGSAVDAPGGPVLDVTAGDDVTIVLHNQLDVPTSLVVRGQSMVTDLAGASPGGTAIYSFTAGDPGTVIYEAGTLEGAQYQSAMGLHGALRVLPASGATPDAVVLVSEVDPALNSSADPAAFDMRAYAPKYELINGSTYPDTAALASVDAGGSLLLRYVNAGTNYHSMGVLGADQRVVADDGHALDEPYTVVAQTVGPGQTVDAVVDVSNQAVVGTRLAVYDAAIQLNGPGRRPATATATVSYGGALGFVEVTGTAAGGPLAIDVDVDATAITATIDDARTGGQNIQAAEFHVDSLAGAGTSMSASDGSYNSPVEGVTAARPASLSNGGLHTVYVRGQDALGNWGPFSSFVVSAVVGPDSTGPVVSAIAMAPNPTNGTSAVALQASASDAATGGSNVTAAEYTIDGGTAVALTVSPTAVTASLDGTIAAGVVASLSSGTHVVAVRAQDSLGNWGDPVSADLVVDRDLPTVSGVAAAPNPSNGLVGVNPGTPAVRISATATDGTSALSAAEGFIDTVGTNGTGFVFAPTDGTWSSSTETILSDIPLATIQQLSDGNHTIYVHAKDAAGNWGATSTVVLVVDKAVPTATITLAGANPTNAASVGFTVTFSESVTGGAAADFTLVQGGGLSGSTISSVTGSGTTRTVTVAVGSGSGTLGLNLSAASSFSDAAGNAPAAVTGPQYTIQGGAPPAVAGIAPTSTNPAGVANLAFTVTFSQPVTGGSAANFTLVTSGISGASITSVTGTGSTRTVTVNTGTGAGTLRLDLTSSAGITGSGGGLTGLPFTGTTWSVPSPVYFSTAGNTNPTGLGGTADDADVYLWNAGVSPRAFNRSVDVTAITNPLPAGANVDALERIDATHFLVSFADAVAVPGAGTVQDEDIVYYNNGAWSLVFDGSANGIATTDVDAISLVGATLYFSTDNNDNLPGVTGAAGDDADIYRWNGGASYTRIIDASAVGWSTDNVDGLTFIDATHMYLSYGVDTTVPGLGAVADEDVVYLNGATWSTYFDGSIVGMTDPNLNVDAFDLP